MTLGQLFVLFGVKVNQPQFKAAKQAIAALRAAAVVSGVVELGRSITHLTMEASESATHIVSLSQAMGMTITETQQWGYVAEQSGSNVKELSVGVNMLLGNLRKLADGKASKSLQATFAQMGLGLTDAKKAMKTGVGDVLMHLADQIQRAGNTGRTAALMRNLVGARAARAMTADLARGSSGIRELMAHQQEIGGVVGEQQILDLRQLANAFNDLRVAWRGAVSAILGALAPMLSKLLEDTARWFAENRDLIGGALTVAVYALAGAFQAVMVVVDAFASVIRAAMRGDAGAVGLVVGLTFVLLALAKAVLVVVIPALWGMVAPILAATWPVFLIGLAIAAVTAGIVLLVKHWDVVVAALRDGALWVFNAMADLGELLFKTLAFLGRVTVALGGLLVAAFRVAVNWVAQLGRAIRERIVEAMARAGEAIRGVGRTIKEALVAAWDGFAEAARNAVDRALELLRALGRRIRQLPGIKQVFDLFTHDEGPAPGAGSPEPQTNATAAAQRPPPVTNVPPGYPASPSPVADRDRGPTSVSVGPTTVNLYGVKDATEARNQFADAVDGVHRHAAAALNGEVQ